MLIQNLKCGHLCLIWSLVAVRIPRGTSSRAHSSTSRIFFGYACQRSRDLVLCHMLSQSQSLSYASPHPQSQNHRVPVYPRSIRNPNPIPIPNPISRPSTLLGPLSSATHNSDRSGENLRLITRPSVCRNCLLAAEPSWAGRRRRVEIGPSVPVYVECRLKPKQCRNCLAVWLSAVLLQPNRRCPPSHAHVPGVW